MNSVNFRSDNLIQIDALCKNYNSVGAVNNVSFDVKRGEMFGLVGPDGAGKTTIIRIMCGLLPYDGGEVFILNEDLRKKKKQIQKNIGYLSQKFSLYGDLTIDENIEFFADIHNVSNYHDRRNELLEFTRLIPFRTRLADNLSGGMKQKLALACSLIHKPKILFLDEPTTGVDPVSRRDFWKILSKLIKTGVTIFMSTPYLDEAERCHRVALLNNGNLLALNTPEQIKSLLTKKIIEIVCSPIRKAYSLIKVNLEFEVQLFGDRINILVNDFQKDFELIKNTFSQNNIIISGSREVRPSLENTFIYLIKNSG
jgi:ABC-2 type transport system ATP-binding protein